MLRIWTAIVASSLILVVSFQNCSEQKSANPSVTGTRLEVEPEEEGPVTEGELPVPEPSVKVQDLLFGYDEATDTFAYSLNLNTGNIVNGAGTSVKTLTAEELAKVVGFFSAKLVYDPSPHNPAICPIADFQGGTFAQLTTSGDITHRFNTAAFNCGGKDFATEPPNSERIRVDVGGTMLTLQEILGTYQNSIENP